MENDELRALKREYSVRLDQIERKHLNFKRRVCLFLNLFVPGFGYFIFGAGYLKGVLSLSLFYGYGLFFQHYLVPMTDLGVTVIYSIPLAGVWIASAIGVGGLEE